MKNGKLIIFIGIILLVVFAFSYTTFIKKETDSVKFKKEYEALNGDVAYKEYKYQKLTIDSNNPVVYADYDELVDVIENKTGVIYLGFPNCPWCRTALPVLLDVLEDYKVDKLYYMNIYDIRDSYTLVDGKVVIAKDEDGKKIKGTDGYFKLLDALDSVLDDYVLTDPEGAEYNVGEKRIYAPTVVFVKDGKIIGAHIDTVETQDNGFDPLTKEEKKELYEIYEDYILEITNTTCKNNRKC